MGKSADQLRKEIGNERSDAGRKIDRLEDQVQERRDYMQEQVEDTAEHVRDQAKGVMDDARDTIQSFDFQRQIDQRPLVAAGAALVGGFMIGGLTGGGHDHGSQHHHHYESGRNTTSDGQHMQQGGGVATGIRNAAKKSGLEDTAENAAAALLGSVTEQLKNTLNRQFPGYADKMETAEHQGGSFSAKAKVTQQDAQQA